MAQGFALGTPTVPIPVSVANGGTGDSSLVAYAPLCGGNSTTSPVQSASTGQSNATYVLTSNGGSALPSFQLGAATFLSYTPVSSGSVIVDLTNYVAVYAVMILMPKGLFPSVNGESLFMLSSTNGGVSYLNSGYVSGYNKNAYNTATLTNGNSTTQYSLTSGIHASGGGNGVNGILYYFNVGGNATLIGQLLYDDTATNTYTNSSIFAAGPQSADHLKFTTTSGLITNGGVSLLGIRYA